MPEFLSKAAPKLYDYMNELDVAQTISLSMTIPQRYIMSIFTCEQPIEVSKFVFDLFIFEQSGEVCLWRTIKKMLQHVEERCLKMNEHELFTFINKGEFVQVCMKEVPLTQLFADDAAEIFIP